MHTTAVILDNIRSVHNVGSIFRTADAAGVSKLYLVGVTPTPVDRFGRARKDIAKVALGAEASVPWEHCGTPGEAIAKLRALGHVIIAVEQASGAKDYREIHVSGPTAFVFGNEVGGVSREFLSHSDTIIEIPMHGTKESLNVSVAVGIVLFSVTTW